MNPHRNDARYDARWATTAACGKCECCEAARAELLPWPMRYPAASGLLAGTIFSVVVQLILWWWR